MTQRICWGISILLILLMGVSIAIIMQDTDIEVEYVYYDLLQDEEKQVNSQIKNSIEKEQTQNDRSVTPDPKTKNDVVNPRFRKVYQRHDLNNRP